MRDHITTIRQVTDRLDLLREKYKNKATGKLASYSIVIELMLDKLQIGTMYDDGQAIIADVNMVEASLDDDNMSEASALEDAFDDSAGQFDFEKKKFDDAKDTRKKKAFYQNIDDNYSSDDYYKEDDELAKLAKKQYLKEESLEHKNKRIATAKHKKEVAELQRVVSNKSIAKQQQQQQQADALVKKQQQEAIAQQKRKAEASRPKYQLEQPMFGGLMKIVPVNESKLLDPVVSNWKLKKIGEQR